MRLLSQRSAVTMATPFRLTLLVLLAAAAQAQNNQNTDTTTQQQNTDTATQTAAQTKTQATTNAPTQGSLTNLPDLSSTASSTDSGSDAPTTAITGAPAISSTSIFQLTGVPTIAGYGVPTQVVPWTAGAPYMQKSNLPEGTVFIAVGAILGFMGVAVLAWRGLVAWSLHRSVRRAALNAQRNDSMTKLSKPATSYGGAGLAGSTLSLDRLSTPAGKLSKHSHGHNPSNVSPSQGRNSSLFFSPTAGAGNHSSPAAAMMAASANRSSAYLPAGYYAAPGAAAPAQGANMVNVGSGASPLSRLNPLHPSRAGYAPQSNFGPSPPGSPSLPPSRPSTEALRRGNGGYSGGYERMSGYGGNGREPHSLYNQSSASTLNLHVPGGTMNGQRAPSANLEDLFENHGNGPRERY